MRKVEKSFCSKTCILVQSLFCDAEVLLFFMPLSVSYVSKRNTAFSTASCNIIKVHADDTLISRCLSSPSAPLSYYVYMQETGDIGYEILFRRHERGGGQAIGGAWNNELDIIPQLLPPLFIVVWEGVEYKFTIAKSSLYNPSSGTEFFRKALQMTFLDFF